jgi:hypothetical protein
VLVDPNLDPNNIDPLQVLRRIAPALAPGTLAGGREIPVSGALASKLLTGDSAPSEASARPSERWPSALVPLRPPVLAQGREIPMASDGNGGYAPLRPLASGGLASGNLNVATPAAATGAAPAPVATATGLPALQPGTLAPAAAGTPYLRTPELRPAATTDTGSAPLTAGSGLPALRPSMPTPPDPNDPRYQLHGAKKVGLGILGGLAGLSGHPELAASLNPYQRAMTVYNRDVEAEKTRLGLEDTQSQIELRRAETARAEREANKPDNPEDKKIDEGFNADNQRVLTFQRPNGETYTKAFPDITRDQRQTHTSPFEAFAYGTAEERKAAQDFLDLEKRVGRRYEKPGEVEQRYSLYQKDPEAYKAMFGDRPGAQDAARTAKEQANATRMLNYFGKQRQQIESDWTLDETQKAAKLAEIEQLSQPYLNAAQPGGANGTGGAEDRVTVRDSKGNIGTVPRSKLGNALKKGYALAQ